MNRTAIADAMRGPLYAAALGVPIAWPNVPAPGDAPRVDVTWTDPDRTSPTVDTAAATIERGRLILSAVVDADGGEDAGNALADSLAAAYPAGLRLTGTGVLIVLGVPTVRSGYRDGDEWRVPVVAPYDAYSTA